MTINHKHIFDAANDLRIGSKILANKFGEPVFPLRSTIVTAAFSAELYLKCLLYVSDKDVPRGSAGHDLKILYQNLGKDLQQKIESNKGADCGTQSISDLMEELRNTFGDWRYIYEKQGNTFSLNFRALRGLVQALDKTVREVKPEWE